MRIGLKVIYILAAVAAVSLPFINRAYFVDDYYHVTMAKGILQNPSRPYDFQSDDTGENVPAWERGSFPRMVNPPLMHYYLALMIKLFGEEEYKIRLSFLIFPIIAALSAFFIMRRFTEFALEAALLFVFSQAFWLSAYSLMIDMAAVAIFLLGFEMFIRGCEHKRVSRLLAAGLLLALAPMAKYTMYAGYFFVLAWLFASENKTADKIKYASVMFIPLLIAVLWALWNVQVYGQSHMLASFRRSNTGGVAAKILVGLIFAGGTSIFSLFCIFFAFKESKKFFAVLAGAGSVLFLFFSSAIGGFDYLQAFLMAVFISAAVAGFYIFLRRPGDYSKFMLVWFFAGLIFVLLPIPWVAGRYFLITGAPFAVLCVQAAQKYFPGKTRIILYSMIALSASVGLLTAIGDYMQSEVYRKIAEDTAADNLITHHNGKKIIFGDAFFGFSHYLKKNGWEVVFDEGRIEKGDLVLISKQSIPIAARPMMEVKLEFIKSYAFTSKYPVRVMDLVSSAGFYASASGALPFSVSFKPIDTFALYRVM